MGVHVMRVEQQTGREALFACPECGRRLVLNTAEARLTVIERGDQAARHTGGTGGVTIQPG